ncbi:terminase [Bacillus cereus group sp. BfR-BA-00331]|uniref:terminase n=1 Tax=Bacillus cereus group TaxID=86661 RepID=UPI0007723057|nr:MULTISPECIES: terminase [Bacillus cereus group]ONG70133.1 terminase [Bacillus cereus]MDA2192080.1 terminase [Bacillus cereus group sp. Bc238]MDA2197579.1 terminase [Bacillus cereus group sp. Bc237]MDA2756297.1 terminase [Bacillus cereus group sp. Bc007]MDA2761738.1 terminase [Bacillus cereus group sp. Bc008]
MADLPSVKKTNGVKTTNAKLVESIKDSKTLQEWRDSADTNILLSPNSADNERQFHIEIPQELVGSMDLKQIEFIHHLIENRMNVSRASELTGISESWGRVLSNMPSSRAYLTALRNQRSAIDIVTYNELLEILSSIARGNDSDDFVNAKTNQVTQIRTPSNVRVAAAQTLAKYMKILWDGPNTQSLHLDTHKIVVDIEDLDDEFQELELKDITPEPDVIDIKE